MERAWKEGSPMMEGARSSLTAAAHRCQAPAGGNACARRRRGSALIRQPRAIFEEGASEV
eukprot:2772847-Pyramimonas_sp.AAC.1